LWKKSESDPSPPPTQQSGICVHSRSLGGGMVS